MKMIWGTDHCEMKYKVEMCTLKLQGSDHLGGLAGGMIVLKYPFK